MYLPPTEMKIIKSMRNEWEEYFELFGKHFKPFNHDQWFGKDGKSAIEVWRDALLECLKNKTPYVWIPEEHTRHIEL